MKDIILKNYQLNTMVLEGLVKDLKETDTLVKTGKSNTVGWILGHIILGRGSVLNMLKKDYQKMDAEDRYKRGSEKNTGINIDLLKAMTVFKNRGKHIEEAIMNIEETMLNKEITYKLPGGGNRIKDAILFSAWHETFHIGQIDLIIAAECKGGIK